MWDRLSATQQLSSPHSLLLSDHQEPRAVRARGILVATDLSDHFEQPICRAAQLAQQHGSQLTVLHVVDGQLPAHTATQLMAGAREAIRACLDSMPGLDIGPAQIVVTRGEIARNILDEVVRRDCDLIVLGAHHMTEAGHLHCCTIERVVQATRVPVLTVQSSPNGPYQNVLAAVDFSEASCRGLQSALRLAPNAQFRCLHAYRLPLLGLWARNKHREGVLREANANLAHILQYKLAADLAHLRIQPDAVSCVLKQGNTLDVIDQEVQLSKADLLVLGAHHTMAVRDTRLGSVTLAILCIPPCDVLFQPDPGPAETQCHFGESMAWSSRPTPATHCR